MSRLRLPGLGLAVLAAFALLHALDLPLYNLLTRIPDGLAKPHPFVDMRAILQGGACWRQGVNVYAPSACLDGGTFNYSPLLLRLAWLPFGPADTLWLGWVACAAYLAALALLPPPHTRPALWLSAAAAYSPAALYALEQGNLDVIIFAAITLALALLARGRTARLTAYAIFAAGAAAKFYPAALLALALREDVRTRRRLMALGAAGAAVALLIASHGIFTALATIPSGTPFRATFGRIDLPRGLALMGLWPRAEANALSWGLTAAALALAWRRRTAWPTTPDPFLLGAALATAFCFIAAQNVEYRAIYLLPALPALLRAGRRASAAVLVALLWEAVPRALLGGLTQPYLPAAPAFAFFLLREALWWVVFVEAAAIALAFAIPRLFDASRPAS